MIMQRVVSYSRLTHLAAHLGTQRARQATSSREWRMRMQRMVGEIRSLFKKCRLLFCRLHFYSPFAHFSLRVFELHVFFRARGSKKLKALTIHHILGALFSCGVVFD